MSSWLCATCGREVTRYDDRPGLGQCPDCRGWIVDPLVEQLWMGPEPMGTGFRHVELSASFRSQLRLERLLGSGAVGVVYRGVQISTGRAVAVKFLGRVDDSEALVRFQREGAALSKVRHPAVVQVFDVDQEAGHPYLLLELVDGESLRSMITRDAPLNPMRVLSMMKPILAGLQACHDLDIVHRDLKPENIILTKDGRPKIADFGLARLCDGVAEITQATHLIGTPRYMAPEMIGGQLSGPPADIYALGVMAYEMLTGRPPFEADNVTALLAMHAVVDAPPMVQGSVGPPSALEEVVRRCLAKQPEGRPQRPSDLIQQLEMAMPETTVSLRRPRHLERRSVDRSQDRPASPASPPSTGTEVVATEEATVRMARPPLPTAQTDSTQPARAEMVPPAVPDPAQFSRRPWVALLVVLVTVSIALLLVGVLRR